jgi:regulation of enolase protein 1 (concanavalin A-like superfamily)
MKGAEMSYSIRFALLTCAVWLPMTAVAEKAPQAIEGWGTVSDPDGDCMVVEKKGEVTITLPKARHDLVFVKHNAPRILQPVEGDFTLQVKVRKFPPPKEKGSAAGKYSFAGLLLWLDEKNYLRLERAIEGDSDTPFVWLERFTNGKSVLKEMKPLEDVDTNLRVVRKGNQFTFLFDQRGEGKDWTEMHAEDIQLPAKLSVGVAAVNTTNREFSVTLTSLKLDTKK